MLSTGLLEREDNDDHEETDDHSLGQVSPGSSPYQRGIYQMLLGDGLGRAGLDEENANKN